MKSIIVVTKKRGRTAEITQGRMYPISPKRTEKMISELDLLNLLGYEVKGRHSWEKIVQRPWVWTGGGKSREQSTHVLRTKAIQRCWRLVAKVGEYEMILSGREGLG